MIAMHCNVNKVPRPGCNAQAVSDDFYFQMYYDNLPIWGFIGKPGPLILLEPFAVLLRV